MVKGFFNKILRINLKIKTFKEETLPDSVYETYLGGKGLGTYLLMRENPPGVDPFSPENRLIFCTGPITNTRIYGSCRHGVFTKSPLTCIYSESHSGGKVAEPMSRASYDAFIFEGPPISLPGLKSPIKRSAFMTQKTSGEEIHTLLKTRYYEEPTKREPEPWSSALPEKTSSVMRHRK